MSRRKNSELQAQKKKKRHKKRRSGGALASGVSTLFWLFVIAAIGVGLVFSQFTTPGPLEQTTKVLIERGDSPTRIANRLEQAGVIASARHFKFASLATQNNGRLKAGEFEFTPGMSLQDVINHLVKGKTVQRFITFPEGLTSLQMVSLILDHPDLKGDLGEVPAEGSLMPATYDIQIGMDRSDLIKRMQGEMQKAVAGIWASRSKDTPVQTPEEMVTLASIVERETGVASERPLVASVFANRLRTGMKLQSDPTIIYGLVGGQGTLGRGLRKSEIRSKTAYNTYVIPGLPPTPIANPGRDAMKAVVNPAKSDYVFFVADGTGGHAFAKTYQEHEANVRKWRQIEQDRKLKQN